MSRAGIQGIFPQPPCHGAGDILASLDNVLAEKAAGMPGNIADAVNGCWQCHGTIIKFKRDAKGDIVREGKENKPVIDADTWPNSGIGRLNPDGSKGSCNACHSRHSFEANFARAPENCGKCHMGPDHPQIEIYNESKHGIAFYANRDKMALGKGLLDSGRGLLRRAHLRHLPYQQLHDPRRREPRQQP